MQSMCVWPGSSFKSESSSRILEPVRVCVCVCVCVSLSPSVPVHVCVYVRVSLQRRWYSDRQEVRKWQEDTRAKARAMANEQLTPCVYTLLGRTRPLPDLT